VTLILTRLFTQAQLDLEVSLLDAIRGHYQDGLMAGLVTVPWLTRHRPWFERIVLLQLAVPLLSGRWGHEYNAWVVPLAVLANQKGVIPWGFLTLGWMLIEYWAFMVPPSAFQDNLYRTANVIGFVSWLSLAAWFAGCFFMGRGWAHRFLMWFTSPLFQTNLRILNRETRTQNESAMP
jgi:hypothetical protein